MSGDARTVEFDEKSIDAIFADFDQCHLPGAAVGVAIGGKPVYRKGFGLASMELPIALSPSIRMRIYSTSKHFTCLAYMLLCEEGKADLDDPLGEYLPDLHPIVHSVTLGQIMGHTSGLRDAHDINWNFSGTGRPVSSAELLSFYRDIDDVNFAPGTGWSYNNGGFLLLSFAIEQIYGQSLEDVFRERIFDRVGMYDTLLRRVDTGFVPHSATMHMATPAGGFEKSYLCSAWAGEGGIVSTINDMLRWLAHMDAPVVGSASTWTQMKTPQILANGTSTGYGLGLISGCYRGFQTLSHAGGGMGGSSQMLKIPAAELDIVIMANRHDASGAELAFKILDACLPDLDPVAKPFRGPFATGTFRSSTTGRVIQLRTGSANHSETKANQQIAEIDGLELPLEAGNDGVLRPAGVFGYLKLGVALAGDPANPGSICISNFGNLDDLVPVLPVGAPDVGKIVGRYRSDRTGTEAMIFDTAEGLRLTTVGRFGSVVYLLERLADGTWRARSVRVTFLGGIVSFAVDRLTFYFTTYRNSKLLFRRCLTVDSSPIATKEAALSSRRGRP
jgi:D-aminopeptidase